MFISPYYFYTQFYLYFTVKAKWEHTCTTTLTDAVGVGFIDDAADGGIVADAVDFGFVADVALSFLSMVGS